MFEEFGKCGVDFGPARGGESDVDSATVVRVGVAADESAGNEAVNPVGHGARGHHHFVDQSRRTELVGRTCATQGRENVKRPHFKSVGGECFFAC